MSNLLSEPPELAPVGSTASTSLAVRVLNVMFVALALFCFVWTWNHPWFRGPENLPNKEICLPIAVAVSLLIIGLAYSTRIWKFGLWITLAILGQATSHQLIDAGPIVRYQHYRSPDRFMDADTWPLLVFLMVQSVLVTAGIVQLWPNLRRWLKNNFKGWHISAIVLSCVLTSATLSREPITFVFELVFAGVIQLIGILNILLAVAALPESMLKSIAPKAERDTQFDGTACTMLPAPKDNRQFVILLAVIVIVVTACLSYFVYERHPHVPDEVVYLLHARYFAAGMLTMPAPPDRQGFDVDLMQYETDYWFSPTPLGWPAILAIGVKFGVPWLVNPVLAGLNVLLTYALLKNLYGTRFALLSVILFCLSPWQLFMAMNFMTHTSTLSFALAAALAVNWYFDSKKLAWAFVGGSCAGVVSLIRPLEGLATFGLLGAWLLWSKSNQRRWMALLSLAAGSVIIGGITLPYNYALTGSPFSFPINVYCDKTYGPGTNSMGFGSNRGLGWTGTDPLPGHGLIDVLINANLNIFAINIELFGWVTGSLFFIAVFFFAGQWLRADRIMLMVIAMIVGIHSFYWFSGGPDFGARYWYLVLIPCIALTVRGIEILGNGMSDIHRKRMHLAVACLFVMTIFNFMPWRAIDKYTNYRGMRPDIITLDHQYHFGKSLVLIQGNRHPDYASAAVYNPLDLNAEAPIYAWDRSPEVRERLLKVYPDRPIWFVQGPTLTKQGFKLMNGPDTNVAVPAPSSP